MENVNKKEYETQIDKIFEDMRKDTDEVLKAYKAILIDLDKKYGKK